MYRPVPPHRMGKAPRLRMSAIARAKSCWKRYTLYCVPGSAMSIRWYGISPYSQRSLPVPMSIPRYTCLESAEIISHRTAPEGPCDPGATLPASGSPPSSGVKVAPWVPGPSRPSSRASLTAYLVFPDAVGPNTHIKSIEPDRMALRSPSTSITSAEGNAATMFLTLCIA